MPETVSPRLVLDWMRDHHLDVTLGLFAFLLLKVVIVTRGSLDAAMAVVSANGVVTVVVGEVLSALPILAVLALGVTAFELGRHPRRVGTQAENAPPSSGQHSWARVYAVPVAAAITFIAAAFAPAFLFLAVGGFAFRAGRRDPAVGPAKDAPAEGRSAWPRLARRTLAAIVIVPLGFISFFWGIAYVMWIPHERLVVTGQQPPVVVGYVVSDSNGWTTVLVSGTRRPVLFEDSKITDRQVCHVQSRFEQYSQYSLVQYAFRALHEQFGVLPRCRPKKSVRPSP